MMPLDDVDAAPQTPPPPSLSRSEPPSAAANASRTWPRVYSTALSKSVKAMMRRRRMGESDDGDQQQHELQQQSDERALERLLLAVESKEPHETLAAVTQHPQALRQPNEVSFVHKSPHCAHW